MKILLLGETAGGSAEYIKDCLTLIGHQVTHVDSAAPPPKIKSAYDAIIDSDYPARRVNAAAGKAIIRRIEQGTRFIMIGGWASFNGRGNSYLGHPLARVLPVSLMAGDDRRNLCQGLLLCPATPLRSPVKLDWKQAPTICGYNQTTVRAGATVLVWAKPIVSDGKKIRLDKPVPMVVKGSFGRGITIACMTDLTPHWCGGLVDWGRKRRKLNRVEVGDMYIQFIRFLLTV